jgi:OPT oligopeptide transporter protein
MTPPGPYAQKELWLMILRPWYAIANVLIGCFIFIVVSALGVHYSGAWSVICKAHSQLFSLTPKLRYADYFPMQDSQSYDNTGHLYNVSRILNPNLELNETLYKAYSPIFLSTNFALSYGISFATMAAVVVHVAL